MDSGRRTGALAGARSSLCIPSASHDHGLGLHYVLVLVTRGRPFLIAALPP